MRKRPKKILVIEEVDELVDGGCVSRTERKMMSQSELRKLEEMTENQEYFGKKLAEGRISEPDR